MTRYQYQRRGRNKRDIAWRIVVNSYPCPTCPAGPGQACVSESGHAKPEPHAARSARAAARGWAHADEPARCVRCHGPLPADVRAPARCLRCTLREDGPAPMHATEDNPGPDGSYDVPLDGMED